MCICVFVCACLIVNKHFSSSADGLWRAALISNIIYLLVPCVGHTHIHTYRESQTHMEWQKFCSLFHHAPTINLIPSSFPFYPLPQSLPPSFLEIDGGFCHPMLHFVQYSSEGKKRLISHSMNFHKLCSAVIFKWMLQARHTCAYDRTHQQPHYPSSRRELCFVPLESDSDLWWRGVTLHPDTHSNTKQGYWPKNGYKERLLLPPVKPHWLRCTEWFGVNITSMQPNRWIQLTH